MTDEIRQCYMLLEVHPEASCEEIRRAYKELIKVWHPDRFPNDARLIEKANEKLKLINLAYKKILTYLESQAPPQAEPQSQASYQESQTYRYDYEEQAPRRPERTVDRGGARRTGKTARQQVDEEIRRTTRARTGEKAQEETLPMNPAMAVLRWGLFLPIAAGAGLMLYSGLLFLFEDYDFYSYLDFIKPAIAQFLFQTASLYITGYVYGKIGSMIAPKRRTASEILIGVLMIGMAVYFILNPTKDVNLLIQYVAFFLASSLGVVSGGRWT